MATRDRSGPLPVEAPRLPAELAGLDGAAIEDGDVLDGVRWSGEAGDVPPEGRSDLAVSASRLAGVRLTGTAWEGLTLVDVEVRDCEMSGVTLAGARCERVAFTGCRMSGLVAEGLRARHVRFVGCQMDAAWLRGATFERCELVDCDLSTADLHRARLLRTRFLDCRLDGVEVSGVEAEEVALHGSSLERASGLATLRGLVVGHDQVLTLALPLLAAQGIRVDDDYLDALAAPGGRQPAP
jgi:uncharacterized protein YjbI with pentapeptide repeats